MVGFLSTAGTFLDQLFVDPDYQMRGIAKTLMTQADPDRVQQNTPARCFYERLGFREVRRFQNVEANAVELLYSRFQPRTSEPIVEAGRQRPPRQTPRRAERAWSSAARSSWGASGVARPPPAATMISDRFSEPI